MNNIFNTDSSNSGFISQISIDQHPFFTQIKKIESGGFNQLYTANRLGKKWLLKGLKPEYQQQSLYVELLKKESDILLSLSYPYIVHSFGMEIIPELGPCIIMEYIDGTTLEEVLQKGITQKQKLKILDQIIEALHYIHEKQIVHRDLKPANILITYNGGNVKLIDFGLADTDAYCILKQPAGTLDYISPEQLQGGAPDIRNDIYSLGKIMENFNLGHKYSTIVLRCLQPLAQRYTDTQQLAEALQQVNKRRNIVLTTSIASVLVIFLCYLTWQIQEIQQKIPNTPQQELTQIKTASMSDGTYPPNISPTKMDEPKHSIPQKDGNGERTKIKSEELNKFIQEGINRLDKYIKSTKFDKHINSIISLDQLDYNQYATIGSHASDLITLYINEIGKKCNSQQLSYIEEKICLYLANQYLDKWNNKVDELANKQIQSNKQAQDTLTSVAIGD